MLLGLPRSVAFGLPSRIAFSTLASPWTMESTGVSGLSLVPDFLSSSLLPAPLIVLRSLPVTGWNASRSSRASKLFANSASAGGFNSPDNDFLMTS